MLPITSLYAAPLTLLFVGLSIWTVMQRGRTQTALGMGEHDTMLRAARAQGNFAEYTPLGLILLGLLEMSVAPHWILHGLGLLLLIGRCSHAYSLLIHERKYGKYAFRILGMVPTFTMLSISALLLLFRAF